MQRHAYGVELATGIEEAICVYEQGTSVAA